jgi:hypothetical protein
MSSTFHAPFSSWSDSAKGYVFPSYAATTETWALVSLKSATPVTVSVGGCSGWAGAGFAGGGAGYALGFAGTPSPAFSAFTVVIPCALRRQIDPLSDSA